MRSFIKRRTLRLLLLLFLVSIFLSNCNLIDSIFNDPDDITVTEEDALNEVLSMQNEASTIVSQLFAINLDTLSVIDSVYNYFINKEGVEFAEADSQGVAVDYKNGISGGVYFGPYNYPIIEVSDSEVIDVTTEDPSSKSAIIETFPTLKNKKAIYFDGAYSEFKKYSNRVIAAANAGFANIGMSEFEIFTDEQATVDVLLSLDEYGLIHITGHGFYRSKLANGFHQERRTYLLTGEKAEIGKTFGNYYAAILEKKIIVVNYKGKNCYAVHPAYVSENNTFPPDEVFLYLGICNGGRGYWRTELVKNNGIAALIGYNWSVDPKLETVWAEKMYQKMCDTSLENPMSVSGCIHEIVNIERGFFREVVDNRDNTYYYLNVFMKPSGNVNFTFWKPEAVFEDITLNFKLQMQHDATCDGNARDPFLAEQSNVYHKYINANLTRNGNDFTAAWNVPKWYEETQTFSGSISFTIENAEEIPYQQLGGKEVTNVLLQMKWGPPGLHNREMGWDVTMTTAEFIVNDSYTQIGLQGLETCNGMSAKQYYFDCMDQASYSRISNTGANCEESSKFWITIKHK